MGGQTDKSFCYISLRELSIYINTLYNAYFLFI